MDSHIALILAVVAVFVVGRWLWPFGRCRACGGSGKSFGSNSRRWGTCGRCGGSGTRVRFGARKKDR